MKEKIFIGLCVALAYAAVVFGASGRIVTHADVALTNTLANVIVPILSANPGRKTVCCQNTGGTNAARVGDANTSATQGFALSGSGQPSSLCFDTDDAIFGFSASGTTIGCNEIMNP